MNEAFLCLGGNIGNRVRNIKACKRLIAESCGEITAESRLYETAPWGSNSTFPYLNQVIRIRTRLNARKLLAALLKVEKQLGRIRDGSKNADRIMDVDILFFNDEIFEEKELVIPHPRMHLRRFVLKPMTDIAPGFTHPFLRKKMSWLLKNSPDKTAVREFRVPVYICFEGNIGSGKTTVATALAKKLNAGFLAEQFAKNDLLPLFYNAPERFAFPLEYSFLLARFQQIRDAFKKEKQVIVSDYSIYKCLWFAAVNLSERDHHFFEKHFATVAAELPEPDLIVYLETSPSNLLKNIKTRGRSYEQNIGEGYLKRVNAEYRNGLSGLKESRVIRIPVNSYGPATTQQILKQLSDYIPHKISLLPLDKKQKKQYI